MCKCLSMCTCVYERQRSLPSSECPLSLVWPPCFELHRHSFRVPVGVYSVWLLPRHLRVFLSLNASCVLGGVGLGWVGCGVSKKIGSEFRDTVMALWHLWITNIISVSVSHPSVCTKEKKNKQKTRNKKENAPSPWSKTNWSLKLLLTNFWNKQIKTLLQWLLYM